jgi:hypothetical protein
MQVSNKDNLEVKLIYHVRMEIYEKPIDQEVAGTVG